MKLKIAEAPDSSVVQQNVHAHESVSVDSLNKNLNLWTLNGLKQEKMHTKYVGNCSAINFTSKQYFARYSFKYACGMTANFKRLWSVISSNWSNREVILTVTRLIHFHSEIFDRLYTESEDKKMMKSRFLYHCVIKVITFL